MSESSSHLQTAESTPVPISSPDSSSFSCGSNKVDTHPTTDQYIQREKVINEEFKIWKKTVPLLYESIFTYTLDTPSLTVQSIPGFEFTNDKNEINSLFLRGTFNGVKGGDKQPEYLVLNSIRLPSTLVPEVNNSIPIEVGTPVIPKLQEQYKWEHPGEVNRARYNPTNKQIATFTKSGDLKIFNRDQPAAVNTLQHHSREGFALEWSHDGQYLLSGAEDTQVALWDITKATPLAKSYNYHGAIVNDVAWSHHTPSLFASVSDDHTVRLQDYRNNSSQDPLIVIDDAHSDGINAVEFNPVSPSLFVTGGGDNIINVWDLRNYSKPLRSLFGHHAAVNQLRFNPDEPTILASSSSDRRIHLWDLTKINDAFEKEDFIKNDSHDPVLKFVHGGHTAKICEFDWVKGVTDTIISIGEDNLLQVWKPSIVPDEDEDEEMNDAEEEEEEEEEEEAEEEEEKEEGKEEEKEEEEETKEKKEVEEANETEEVKKNDNEQESHKEEEEEEEEEEKGEKKEEEEKKEE